ncbi:DUF2057 domain-containing protein [Pseudoalteromonas byunsanensis]|uniref:DUF2057 domain-containing protein n=1 Tax=Pseudoalteromonas byunsanensis TaxID=327939 RepID=A0A1S1N883_9GAMM|nr:DUF2057 domain-containing protein [Pseudoalteromonas byunsanensis]OHU97505.1 hypothetical protein BIW53_01705 [Pseudoalteromonas byunsanensis]
MNVKINGLFIALLLLLNLSYANSATVNFSVELYPLQVNDQEVEHSLFSKVTELEVAPGRHILKMKYNDLYELNYDEHEVIESEPFWVVVELTDEGDYQVVFQRPETVDLAKQFAKHPSASLRTPNSQVIALKTLKNRPSLPSERQVIKDEVVIESPTPVVPLSSAPASHKPVKGISHPDAYSMLEFWWQQASEAQRAAFLEKIKGQ